MNRRTDKELLRAYAETRSDDPFRELALRHGPLVYGACLRYLRRAELAEDAAQGVFLVLAEKSGRIRIQTTLVPWLLNTAKHICWRMARAERRRDRAERPLDEEIPSYDSVDFALFEALDRLSGPEREAIVLRFVQGLSLAEVGESQGVSEDAARMRVSRGLARLRQRLAPGLSLPASVLDRLAHPERAPASLRQIALHTPTVMTTILPLALCGIAALGGFATVTVRAAQTAPRTASRIAAKGSPSQNARPQSLAAPFETSHYKRLDKPFTLVYAYTLYSRSTKAMDDWDLADRQKDLQKRVDADEITQEQMDGQMADLRRDLALRTRTGRITLSFDGRSLLVDDRLNGTHPIHHVVIVRGDRTYELFPDEPIATNMCEEGVVSYFLMHVPFVGPSLPFMTIDRGDKVLNLDAVPSTGDSSLNRLQYTAGRIVVGKDGSPREVRIGRHDPPGHRTELGLYRPLLGVAVATRVVSTDYNYWLNWPNQGHERSRTDYSLVRAAPSAIADSAFRPEGYLAEGATVQANWHSGPRRLTYHRADGSLEDQLSRVSSQER